MITYKDSGVNIEAGYEAVKLMRESVRKTFSPQVLTDIGGFGGLYSLDNDRCEEPVLVSGTDGVGTKLKIAFLLDKHDTIGIDCVAMCVNDIICSGAKPLFFLDYIALSKNIPAKVAKIVEGAALGCVKAGCALLGGETAEMPGFYHEDEYDIAGFAVGIVDRKKMIDGSGALPGDVIIGLPSSGLHSNGYSLVRKLFSPNTENLNEHVESLGCTLGEELIRPTRIYAGIVRDLTAGFEMKGIAHITGGGFYENLPRMLKQGSGIRIQKGSWPIHRIYDIIQEEGKLDDKMMFSTFNMGIGMAFCVSSENSPLIMKYLDEIGEKAYIIGAVTDEIAGVEIC
jgi:phosphoribosylformylglycinamidine cyclo-ligase